jgi:hypothetical protein
MNNPDIKMLPTEVAAKNTFKEIESDFTIKSMIFA